MNIYCIKLKASGDTSNFLTKAENASKAISKWLIALKDTLFYDQDIILTFHNIIENSVNTDSEDIFIYDSEDLSIECSRTMEIDYRNLEYDNEDSVLYSYQHLSDQLKLSLATEDVAYILDLEYQYMVENGYVMDEEEEEPQEPPPILDMVILSFYIQKKALEDGIVYLTEHIDEVLEAEAEYMKAVGIIKEDISKNNNDDVIDLGTVTSN